MTYLVRPAHALFAGTVSIALLGAILSPTSAHAQVSSARAATAAAGVARNVEPFEAIVLRGAVNLVLRQGAAPGVWVQASDTDVAGIETRVVQRDGRATLEIDQRRGLSWSARRAPTVTVDWVRLSSLVVQGAGDVSADGMPTPALNLRVQGSGDVTLRRVDTRDLSISIAGSGDVHASGRAAALAIALAGSGDVDASALDADAVSVSIAGSGDVSVKANQVLSAKLAGSGDLRYSGNPQVQSRVAGSGTVTHR